MAHLVASFRTFAAGVLIHLVRHGCHAELGYVLSGRSEIALNVVGKAQAERVATVLCERHIAAICSSPRLRARETAQPLAARCGMPVTTDESLDEIDFGDWTGRPFTALADDPDWQRWNSARGDARAPGGETMRAAVARAVAYIAALPEPTSGSIVLVSHCDIIRGLVAHTLGLSLDRLLAFDIDPGSISTLSVEPWGSRVVALNGGAA